MNADHRVPSIIAAGPPRGEAIGDWRRSVLALIPTEVIRRGNVEVLGRLLARDYVMHDVPTGLELLGRRGYREFVHALRQAFPDLSIVIGEQSLDGDTVRTSYSARATFVAAYRGRPPTGRRIETAGLLVSRFEGPRLLEEWHHYDLETLRHQLASSALRPDEG